MLPKTVQLLSGRATFVVVSVVKSASDTLANANWNVPPPVADLGGDEVIAAKVGDLKPNSAKIFRFGSRPGLLLRIGESEYRAFSATCTHLSCTVQYRTDLHEIWCACHNGMYDLNGRNVSGPPPRPLESYRVHVRGEDLVVNRKREA